MRELTHQVLSCVLAGISAGASAQIYECIDGGGKVEFAQKCAPGTMRQREVAKAGSGNVDGAAPPQNSYKEQEHAFRQRQFEREQQEAKANALAKAAERKCASARSHLVSLENARRVRAGSDPQTGQPRYLDDAERVAAVQKARDSVTANCK